MTAVSQKQSIRDLSDAALIGKRVIVRVDFNVPIKDGAVTDDTRIRLSLPTIQYLIDRQAKVIIVTHFGRPKGQVIDTLKLGPVHRHLETVLGQSVVYADACVGPSVVSAIDGLQNGGVVLLENVRFHSGEEQNDWSFSEKLAQLGDIFVLDAFGAAHRAHASTVGIGQFLPAVAGLLMEKELQVLGQMLSQPKSPFVGIIGGSKVSTKLAVLRQLLSKVDTLIIGGGMVYTFLKVQGHSVGNSLVEDSQLDEAQQFLIDAEKSSTNVVFPIDHVVVKTVDDEAPTQVVTDIVDQQIAVDVGPQTLQLIASSLDAAQTILWNGPLGIFEIPSFANGTFSVAKMLANSSATTVVGGGDSVAAIQATGLSDQISHISTGGGATLAFLEGQALPGETVLMTK